MAVPTPLMCQLLQNRAGAATGLRVGAGGSVPDPRSLTSTLPWRPWLPSARAGCWRPLGWENVAGRAEDSIKHRGPAALPQSPPARPQSRVPRLSAFPQPSSRPPLLLPRHSSFLVFWEILGIKESRHPPRAFPHSGRPLIPHTSCSTALFPMSLLVPGSVPKALPSSGNLQ